MAYATWNPSDKGSNVTLSGSDLIAQVTSGNYSGVRSTLGKSSGKWYCEITIGTATGSECLGFANISANVSGYPDLSSTTNAVVMVPNGNIIKNGSIVAADGGISTGDVLGLAMDLDSGTISWNRNGGTWATVSSGLPASPLYIAVGSFSSTTATFTANFGASAWAYTPPTDHVGMQDLTDYTHAMTGGVSAAGDAAIEFNPREVAMTGGGTVGGDVAMEFPSTLEVAPLWGSMLGGDVALEFGGVDAYDMVGGATVTSESPYYFETPNIYEEAMAGAITLGGATVYEFDGTVLLGVTAGADTALEFFSPTIYDIAATDFMPDGGLRWGGDAEERELTTFVPSGGLALAGGAQIQEVLPFHTSGGSVYAGTASNVSVLAFTPSGGLVYAGVAPNTSVLRFVPSSGLVWSGLATISEYRAWHAPTGGFGFGGRASVVTATAAYGPTTENPTNAPYYGWTINAESAAVSRYLRMPANSMCQMNGKTYVANAGGIYEYGADDDAGQDIRASVQWPKTDFQDGRTKRMEVARFGLKTTGRMRLKAMANEDEPRYYLLMPTSDKVKGTRVPIGKGMAGRYWAMRLDNVAGCDFELDSAEFLPVPSRQRHGA